MKSTVLYQQGNHKWVVIGRDEKKKNEVIDTNEYLIVSNDNAIILDPGGIEIFPQVLTEVTKHVSTEQIKMIFSSHQDPDIASSLALWYDLSDDLQVYTSWLWKGFLSHFGMGNSLKLNEIPDEGMGLNIGTSKENIYFVPAHYCHSSGNFSVYDPKADILFSGDIGAALLPDAKQSMFVDNFDDHIKYMDAFHKRWMPSTAALRDWVERIRAINPQMICPQHGSIFKGKNVAKFLDWLESIEVGVWNKGAEANGINNAEWMKWK
jgi:flavorubredoxin